MTIQSYANTSITYYSGLLYEPSIPYVVGEKILRPLIDVFKKIFSSEPAIELQANLAAYRCRERGKAEILADYDQKILKVVKKRDALEGKKAKFKSDLQTMDEEKERCLLEEDSHACPLIERFLPSLVQSYEVSESFLQKSKKLENEQERLEDNRSHFIFEIEDSNSSCAQEIEKLTLVLSRQFEETVWFPPQPLLKVQSRQLN